MVSAAVDLPVLVEVDQVDQQLSAGNALETLRVPAAAVTRPAGKHSDVSTADLSAALGGGGEKTLNRLNSISFNKLNLPQVAVQFPLAAPQSGHTTPAITCTWSCSRRLKSAQSLILVYLAR